MATSARPGGQPTEFHTALLPGLSPGVTRPRSPRRWRLGIECRPHASRVGQGLLPD